MADTRTIDTGSEHLLARIEDRVAILTMNRPERRNALSGDPMLSGLEIGAPRTPSTRRRRALRRADRSGWAPSARGAT